MSDIAKQLRDGVRDGVPEDEGTEPIGMIYCSVGICCDRIREAGAAEIERLRAERRWIPVTERLPDEDVPVLVWHKGGHTPDIGWREYRKYYIVPETIWTLGDDLDKGYPPQNITHWMPLPAGPAE